MDRLEVDSVGLTFGFADFVSFNELRASGCKVNGVSWEDMLQRRCKHCHAWITDILHTEMVSDIPVFVIRLKDETKENTIRQLLWLAQLTFLNHVQHCNPSDEEAANILERLMAKHNAGMIE